MNSSVRTRAAGGRTRRSRLRFAAALAAGALALSGCAGSATPEASGPGGESLEKMVFLSYLSLDTLSLAPEMLAVAGGYFEKHGLDVQLQPVNGSPVAMQGVLGGIAPITRIGGIDVLTAASKGQDLINVGTVERGGGFRVVSADSDPLESMEDYLGKTIGVGSEGGTSTKTLTLALDNAGIDPADVERQVVGLTPATFALVQQGQLGGYMLGIDTAEMVAEQNPDAVVSGEGLTAAPDIQVYVSTPDAIEKNGDQIRKYLAAIKEAIEFIVADESMDETLEIIRSEYSFASLDDDAVAKRALDAYRKVWVGDGTFPFLETDVDRWEEGYRVLVDAGMSDPGGSPLDWYTNDLLPE